MVVSHTDAEIQEPEKDCTRPDDALVNYTEQQIEDYCEKMDNAGFYAYGPGNWYFDAVQIIRQLQRACGMYHKTFVDPERCGSVKNATE